MKLPDGWYDGEIVVHDENGKPNFNLLQLAFDGSNRAQIVYFMFDAPYFKGYDMRDVRLDAAPSPAAGRPGGAPVRHRALLGRIRHRPGAAGGGRLPDRAGGRDRQAQAIRATSRAARPSGSS
jgi:hypothetical protein